MSELAEMARMLRSDDPSERAAALARLKIGAVGGSAAAGGVAGGAAASRAFRGSGVGRRAAMTGLGAVGGTAGVGSAVGLGLGPGASFRNALDSDEV